MKSTNSAFSDYNFLFENIDQTMNMNTQLLVEELLHQTEAQHRATVSMNEVLPGARGPEEELISIEETYRETAAALHGDFNESSSLLPGGNKSMTIIQEDEGEYEDSSVGLQRLPKAPQLSHRERSVLLQPRESYETFGKLKGDTFRYSGGEEASEDSQRLFAKHAQLRQRIEEA